MRKHIGSLTLVWGLVIVVAFCFGWLHFSTDAEEERAHLKISLDSEKVSNDFDGVRDFAVTLLSRIASGIAEENMPESDGASQEVIQNALTEGKALSERILRESAYESSYGLPTSTFDRQSRQ